MKDITTLVVYTTENILTFNVRVTAPNFGELVATALEDGTPLLILEDGGQLILSGMNFVAIEIKAPPVENI